MPTLTIRNVPEDVVGRLTQAAAQRQHSVEQEIRELLCQRYGERPDRAVFIRERWRRYPSPRAEQVEQWIAKGRA